MNYAEYKEQSVPEFVNEIKEIIKEEGLDSKSRIHHRVHKRAFLMMFLRQNTGLSVIEIGKLFKRDHSSVIHNLRSHRTFTEHKDKEYAYNTKTVASYLEFLKQNKIAD